MKAVIALDLDQTMIYSERSAGALDGVETVWVEDYEGAPLSLMTAEAHRLLSELSELHHVVPVTTRTPEQLARVRLPGVRTHAIAANGGVLLVDDVRDALWDRRVARELSGVVPASRVFARVALEAPWVRTVRQVEDLFVYLVAQSRAEIPVAWLDELEDWALERGWSLSVQGRKVYVVPGVLSKGAAAGRLGEVLGGPLLAAGDSVLDRSLLEQADFAVRPAHGELHDLQWRVSGLVVTQSSGAGAAEEVLRLLRDQAHALTR